MTIIISGVAGFIGSNIARRISTHPSYGGNQIIGIDRLDSPAKVRNIADVPLSDFIDYGNEVAIEGLLRSLQRCIFIHQGACTDTMEHDGKKMMETNFEWSKRLIALCQERCHRFIYASSAAVYGGSSSCILGCNESPLNVYGYSKLAFDRFVVARSYLDGPTQVVGLRYFNVYGPGEQHKESMASCVFKFYHQARTGRISLFEGSDKFSRDFIHVDDVANVVLWFIQNPGKSGIFNCGTGISRTFLELAQEVRRLEACDLLYAEMPPALKGSYQRFTQADIGPLRAAGYRPAFISIEDGVKSYVEYLKACPQ